ncbi:hypothetical protein L484_001553 [Morus notabilis]|uniref:Uncharacterized protein n=1 Tax=Morus notabilis TaxID=981085 RepID=W9R607_9ROSA|nr:hypothetical protein L484_001553 [Morus notabilis]
MEFLQGNSKQLIFSNLLLETLFLVVLLRFDVAGAGTCLKRYTDPSFFKIEAASSLIATVEIQREKKNRKVKISLVVPRGTYDPARLFATRTDTKSFNLKPAAATRPSIPGPTPKTNLKVAAILEKANAIRQLLFFPLP